MRAKVTDFGMAKLGDQNPRATQLTFTMCPGTDVYMPPEAVLEKPVYTEKIDCFSFGVITIQVVTQEFPKPGDRRKRIQINQPGLPPIVEVPISEIERRQNHIGEIDPNHTLLQVALVCLKDRDVERPSAQQLCERIVALKADPRYSESVRAVQIGNSTKQSSSDERLMLQHHQQVQGLQQIIQSLRQQTQQLEREKNIVLENERRKLRQKMDEINRLERQLERVNQQLEESEQANAEYQRQIAELEQLRLATDTTPRSKGWISSRASIKLTWREGKKAPCVMNSYCAAVDDSTLYVSKLNHEVYAYTINTSSWSQLPNSPTNCCPSVIVNNLLTLVGGDYYGAITNQLFSLTGEGSGRRWTEEFPPMPTSRHRSTALCIGTTLIVAGGRTWKYSELKTFEVMNTTTKQWFTATDLPQPLSSAPAAVCGDYVYILAESNMYTCSVLTITKLQNILSRNRGVVVPIWKEVAVPPVTRTTFAVSIHNQLLAIGGKDSDKEPTTAIHIYSPTIDSWEVISHMITPRWDCIAALLPNNQLMVAEGLTGESYTETDSTEFATVELL